MLAPAPSGDEASGEAGGVDSVLQPATQKASKNNVKAKLALVREQIFVFILFWLPNSEIESVWGVLEGCDLSGAACGQEPLVAII